MAENRRLAQGRGQYWDEESRYVHFPKTPPVPLWKEGKEKVPCDRCGVYVWKGKATTATICRDCQEADPQCVRRMRGRTTQDLVSP